MARKNPGGKSVRLDCSISPELYQAVDKYRRRHRCQNLSEVVRIALAALVGDASLAEANPRGRPKLEE